MMLQMERSVRGQWSKQQDAGQVAQQLVVPCPPRQQVMTRFVDQSGQYEKAGTGHDRQAGARCPGMGHRK
jgi:hypothetical protein